jgi:hypothetical protein
LRRAGEKRPLTLAPGRVMPYHSFLAINGKYSHYTVINSLVKFIYLKQIDKIRNREFICVMECFFKKEVVVFEMVLAPRRW